MVLLDLQDHRGRLALPELVQVALVDHLVLRGLLVLVAQADPLAHLGLLVQALLVHLVQAALQGQQAQVHRAHLDPLVLADLRVLVLVAHQVLADRAVRQEQEFQVLRGHQAQRV